MAFGETPVQRFSWLCSDEKWNYMAVEFVRNGVVHAAGMVKGGAVGRDGIIPTAQYLSSFPDAVHGELQRMLARPLTAEVLAWRESELALMQRVQGARG